MKAEFDNWSIEDLIERGERGSRIEKYDRDNQERVESAEGAIFINPEYQRGYAWTPIQMRIFIDSVLRGYPVPPVYLHLRTNDKGEAYYEVIDGQQRMNALRFFVNGYVRYFDFNKGSLVEGRKRFGALYNPKTDGAKIGMPQSLWREYPWSGKVFDGFTEQEKDRFWAYRVPVYVLKCEDDESRDLFIRFQGGIALTPQEKRDALPGQFCELVLRVGGKPQMNRGDNTYDGHKFFQEMLGMQPWKKGDSRQYAAQMLMQFLPRRQEGRDRFRSVDAESTKNFYAEKASMDIDSVPVRRFVSILDDLNLIFAGEKWDKKIWLPMHLSLFSDMLRDDFVSDLWEAKIVSALNSFLSLYAQVSRVNKGGRIDPTDRRVQLMQEFFQGTKASVQAEATIRMRHGIFVLLMLEFLGDSAQVKERDNILTSPDFLEALYYLDRRKCHLCDLEVESLANAHPYHAREHHTQFKCPYLRNHALKHKVCPGSA